MAYSYNDYIGTGVSQTLAVPEYIDQSHIKVSINGVDTTSFSWVTSNTISLTAPVSAAIRVRRESSPGVRLVDYTDGVPLTEVALDTDSKQAFFLSQEQLDVSSLAIDAANVATEAADAAVAAQVAVEAAFDPTVAGLRTDLAATTGPNLVGFNPTLNYVAGTLGARLGAEVFLTDFPWLVAFDGSDESAKIQAAIDAMPSGTTFVLPSKGTVRAHGIKLAGTSGTKINTSIVGQGFGAVIKAPAASALNVIEATAGSGHRISNIRISGSRDTGGAATPGPNKGLALASTSYVIGDRVEVSSADAYTTTVAASNKVYRCVTAHTSGVTFAAGIANWVLTAEPNFNTSDLSYRYSNGVYLDGVSNVALDRVFIDQCVYAGLNIGSGPVQAANIGPGSDRVQTSGVIIATCGNGIAGGRQRDVLHSNLTIYSCTAYGAVSDIGSGRVIYNGVTVSSCGNTAIFGYDVQKLVVDNYAIAACLNGIVCENAMSLFSLGAGTIETCTNVGIYVRGSSIAAINGAVLSANVKGIEMLSCFEVQMSTVTVNATSGASGIKLTSCTNITGGTLQVYSSYGHGIELQSCDQVGLTNLNLLDNNSVNAANGAGVFGNNTNNVQITGGSRLSDTRAGGAKRQKYGVRSEGTSAQWCVLGNRLTGNATGDTSLVGTGNTVEFNDTAVSARRIGSAVVASTGTPVWAAGDPIVVIQDINGNTRYVAAKSASW